MKQVLKSKFNLLYILFSLLAFYPLLKFNYSSIILITSCVVSVYFSVKRGTYLFTASNIKLFLAATSFFTILLLSSFYSTDIGYGLEKTMQLIPLFIVPFVIIFFRPKISSSIRDTVLNVFLGVNFLYSVFLAAMYVLNKDIIGLEGINSSNFLLNYDKVQFVLNEVILGTFLEDILFIHKPYFSMGFVISAIFALRESTRCFNKHKKKSLLYLFFFFYFLLLILYTFSFPNVLALFICIILFGWGKANKSRLKLKKFLVPGTIVLGVLLTGVFYKSKDIGVVKGFNFIRSVVYQESVEDNDARVEIYKSVSNLWKRATASEIIFGYGIGDAQATLHNELKERLSVNKTKNILLYNEQFNSDYWFRNNIEIVPNSELSPDQKKNADRLIEQNNEIAASHNLSTDILLDKNRTYTFSVFAKKGSANYLILRLGELPHRATFNLMEGTIKAKGEGITEARITPAMGEWYRCSITVTNVDSALVIIGISNENADYIYKSSAKEILLWGAQIEEAQMPTAYVKNNFELIDYVISEKLNTHNNYLFFLLSGGVICLLGFVISLLLLLYISFKNRNILQLTFVIVIGLNFLTENILARHWGLMFISMMLFILFTTNSKDETTREV